MQPTNLLTYHSGGLEQSTRKLGQHRTLKGAPFSLARPGAGAFEMARTPSPL